MISKLQQKKRLRKLKAIEKRNFKWQRQLGKKILLLPSSLVSRISPLNLKKVLKQEEHYFLKDKAVKKDLEVFSCLPLLIKAHEDKILNINFKEGKIYELVPLLLIGKTYPTINRAKEVANELFDELLKGRNFDEWWKYASYEQKIRTLEGAKNLLANINDNTLKLYIKAKFGIEKKSILTETIKKIEDEQNWISLAVLASLKYGKILGAAVMPTIFQEFGYSYGQALKAYKSLGKKEKEEVLSILKGKYGSFLLSKNVKIRRATQVFLANLFEQNEDDAILKDMVRWLVLENKNITREIMRAYLKLKFGVSEDEMANLPVDKRKELEEFIRERMDVYSTPRVIRHYLYELIGKARIKDMFNDLIKALKEEWDSDSLPFIERSLYELGEIGKIIALAINRQQQVLDYISYMSAVQSYNNLSVKERDALVSLILKAEDSIFNKRELSIKISILNFLGKTGDKSLLPLIEPYLYDNELAYSAAQSITMIKLPCVFNDIKSCKWKEVEEIRDKLKTGKIGAKEFLFELIFQLNPKSPDLWPLLDELHQTNPAKYAYLLAKSKPLGLIIKEVYVPPIEWDASSIGAIIERYFELSTKDKSFLKKLLLGEYSGFSKSASKNVRRRSALLLKAINFYKLWA